MNAIAIAMKEKRNELDSSAEALGMLAVLQSTLGDIPELEDVSSVAVYRNSQFDDNGKEVLCTEAHFWLKESCKDSKLVHKLAQKFGVKFTKDKHWDNQSLCASGISADLRYKFEVRNYVPSTCALITEETPLTPEEIELEKEKALARVPLTRKTVKVVCA